MEADEETLGEVGCCPRRGRPRVRRFVASGTAPRCFLPQCRPSETSEPVELLPDELECLRLVDLEGLQQEEAATALGVSRKTLWRDLHEARRKVADALLHGKPIVMAGCSTSLAGECPRRLRETCPLVEACPYRPATDSTFK
ncbi:hypothetical protein DSECCO2_607350 [anaerobic digester metagenome]